MKKNYTKDKYNYRPYKASHRTSTIVSFIIHATKIYKKIKVANILK